MGAQMEEILYNIEIHKASGGYLGKVYSEIDGIKEFQNDQLYRLLRDMTIDMELALNEFSSYSFNAFEESF